MAVLAQEPFAAEYSTTTGNGAITLGGRIGNYKTLAEAGVANTNVVMAEIRLVSGGVTIEYEMGFYTYASSGPTLTIVGTPLRSSNSNNKVSWSAGTKQVVLSAPPYLYPRDDRFVLVGSADWTKRARFEVDGVTAGQTRVITIPDQDVDLTPASQAEQEAGSSTSKFVTPGRQQFHPSAVKAWIKAGSNGAISASYNVSSITDAGTGDLVVSWDVDFSSTSYSVVISVESSGNLYGNLRGGVPPTAGAARFAAITASTGALTDPNFYYIMASGDQ